MDARWLVLRLDCGIGFLRVGGSWSRRSMDTVLFQISCQIEWADSLIMSLQSKRELLAQTAPRYRGFHQHSRGEPHDM